MQKLIEHYKHYNTDKFRESALHFKEFGKYTNEYPGSSLWINFWKEEKRRCVEGYNPGHDNIPGYYYWYLNYTPIYKVEYVHSSSNEQIRGNRIEGLPDFWDSDYDYYWYLEESENEGEHAVVVKCRGRGYSFKGGSMLARNYFLIPGSRSYAIASQTEFLIKDGIITKAWDTMDFVDNNTPWGKRREKKNSDLHRKASYVENINGIWIEKGYKSEIIGMSLKDNPDKIRGKRGKLYLFEEGGEFPKLLKAWQIAQKSVQQGKVTFGLMVAFGTGGSSENAATGLEELFYKPKAYNVHTVPNIWDIDMTSSESGLFIPEYRNKEGFMDKDGNSDIIAATEYTLNKRKKLTEESSDPETLLRAISEEPLNPQEAFQRVTGNFFPVTELRIWLNELQLDSTLKNIGTNVSIIRNDEGQTYSIINPNAKPLNKFPTPKGISRDGSTVIYYQPFKQNGRIPDNIYYAVADPYGINSKHGESLGVVYIIAYPNKLTTPDDCIVASYIGRPDDQDDWNRNAFLLCSHYNAKLTPENDRGNIVDYARYHKLLNQLQPEFPIISKNGKEYNKLGRSYGVSMSSIEVKLQAIIYFKQWLLKKRAIDYKGKQLCNYHYIYDTALLEELIKYNVNGNFDRVSALLIHACVREHNINTLLINNGKSNAGEFRKLFMKD